MKIRKNLLSWRKIGDCWELCRLGKPIMLLVADKTYPGMWRVVHDGRLSDMANLTWAKDSAIAMAYLAFDAGSKNACQTGGVGRSGAA